MANFDFAIVKVNLLSPKAGEPVKVDINGLQSVIFSATAGRFPKEGRTISGTIAERQGFEVNKCYTVSIEVLPSNEYGNQYRIENLGEMRGIELIKACKEIGAGIIVESSVKEVEDIKVKEAA